MNDNSLFDVSHWSSELPLEPIFFNEKWAEKYGFGIFKALFRHTKKSAWFPQRKKIGGGVYDVLKALH